MLWCQVDCGVSAACVMLADMGATVIKIDHPSCADSGKSRNKKFFAHLNRGKKFVVCSLTLSNLSQSDISLAFINTPCFLLPIEDDDPIICLSLLIAISLSNFRANFLTFAISPKALSLNVTGVPASIFHSILSHIPPHTHTPSFTARVQ